MKFTKLVLAAVFVALTAPAMAQVDAKVTGRVHFDTRTFDSELTNSTDRDSASVGDNFELRRARIGINGSINKQIQYEVVGNAVGSSGAGIGGAGGSDGGEHGWWWWWWRQCR